MLFKDYIVKYMIIFYMYIDDVGKLIFIINEEMLNLIEYKFVWIVERDGVDGNFFVYIYFGDFF